MTNFGDTSFQGVLPVILCGFHKILILATLLLSILKINFLLTTAGQ